MNALLMTAWEGLTALLPALCLFALGLAAGPRRRPGPARALGLAAFWLYVCAVFHVTGAGTLADARLYLLRYAPEMTLNKFQINLRLFHHAPLVGLVLNLVMFVPFGLLTAWLWPVRRALLRAAGGGLAFSLLIELSQLLNNRCTDVDDLAMNTLGAVAGCGLYLLFCRAWGRTPPRTVRAWEGAAYIGAMFLGRFFLWNEFGLAKLLYKF